MAAVGQIRPNVKMMKIAYAILKTPKQLQQAKKPVAPPSKQQLRWNRSLLNSQ